VQKGWLKSQPFFLQQIAKALTFRGKNRMHYAGQVFTAASP
jgi:hypothetical protein